MSNKPMHQETVTFYTSMELAEYLRKHSGMITQHLRNDMGSECTANLLNNKRISYRQIKIAIEQIALELPPPFKEMKFE